MLKTLNKYIDDNQTKAARTATGRRFSRILAFSIVGHVLFYVVVIKLDQWTYQLMVEQSRRRGSDSGGLVEITELAPPKDSIARLRLPPEALERTDPTRFRIEQSRPDDTQLVATSPRPSGQPNAVHNNAATRPPAQTPRSGDGGNSPVQSAVAPRQAEAIAARPPGVVSPKPPTQPLISPGPAVPSAGNTTATPLRASEDSGPASRGREDGSSPGELGLQAAQSQYIAYVRAKIYRANERFMPRGWVENMLTRKVSADFEISLARGGRLSSMRLVRSCGYSTLDDVARQAINTASPFEGWPPEAGDALTLTVTVYYTPYR